jgi:hypothetical protein
MTNGNHLPGGWCVVCEENLALDEGFDLAPQEADALVTQ